MDLMNACLKPRGNIKYPSLLFLSIITLLLLSNEFIIPRKQGTYNENTQHNIHYHEIIIVNSTSNVLLRACAHCSRTAHPPCGLIAPIAQRLAVLYLPSHGHPHPLDLPRLQPRRLWSIQEKTGLGTGGLARPSWRLNWVCGLSKGWGGGLGNAFSTTI